jgi:RNA polymerase sigma-70 factor (ECF subfamily)
LVERHERAVWATAWRILRDEHAASDAAQESFLQAFRHLDRLRKPDLFGVWVLRIAHREALRMAGRRARFPGLSLEDSGTDPPHPTPQAKNHSSGFSLSSEELLAAIGQLPEHERLVIVARYLEGKPVAEIGAGLGRPVGTVTKQLSRALLRLKTWLREVVK